MESIAFFEKKINLSPNEFNEVKKESIESLLEKKAKKLIEDKCSEQGFVLPGSIKLISRSMGYFESARFTGDAVYYLKLEGKIVYPADGVRVVGEVIRKNKMGLYVDYHKAIRIQVPRDLHIGSEEYEEVEVGDTIEVELKRSKFQINDPYILASAIFIEKKNNNIQPITTVDSQVEIDKDDKDDKVESEVELQEGEEPLSDSEEPLSDSEESLSDSEEEDEKDLDDEEV